MLERAVSKSSASRIWQWAAAAAAVGALMFLLRAVLAPVFTAFLLAYMFDPLVDVFEARRIPRPLGILLLLLGFGLVLGGFGLLVAPTIARDLSALLAELPVAAQRAVDQLVPLLQRLGIELPSSASDLLGQLQAQMTQVGPAALGSLKGAVGAAAGGTASVMGAVAAAIMVPIFTFYLLADFDLIVAEARALIPAHLRPGVVDVVSEVDGVLGQFVRGQLAVMLILAVLYGGGYALVGVPLSVPIGVIAGCLAFIPYVGGAVALGLALLMVALHFHGAGQLVAVLAVYGVVQVLEGFVITPRIVGDKLGLAPVWVLLALMAFGELFGFMGVMLALPAAAIIKVLVGRLLDRYRRSGLLDAEPVSGAQGCGGQPQRVAIRRYRRGPRRGRGGALRRHRRVAG